MNLSFSKSTQVSILILFLLVVALAGLIFMKRESLMPLFSRVKGSQAVKLPAPVYRSNISIEEALKQRRSVRQFKNDSLILQQVSQLLWAAQGITSTTGFRTAPSAGGLYPLEIYVVSGNVQNLPSGVYHYLPAENVLELVVAGDKRNELGEAAHKQSDIKDAALDFIITVNYNKTSIKYGNRSERFADMEAGHAAQNIYLQAVSLGLGTVSIGVFDEAITKRLLSLPRDETPVYIMPVGKPS